MGLVKVLIFIIKMKIFHFGEIHRLISFHYFINKQEIDISELRVLDVGFNKSKTDVLIKPIVSSIEKFVMKVLFETFFCLKT